MSNDGIGGSNTEVSESHNAHSDIIAKINEGCPIIECETVVTEADMRVFSEMDMYYLKIHTGVRERLRGI